MGAIRIFVWATIALSFASTVGAQENLKGEIVTVDEASGKIGVKLTGTVGSGERPPPLISRSKMA
jgi:hypothetical protein